MNSLAPTLWWIGLQGQCDHHLSCPHFSGRRLLCIRICPRIARLYHSAGRQRGQDRSPLYRPVPRPLKPSGNPMAAIPEDKVVTRIIQLKHIDPASVKKILAPLVSKTSGHCSHGLWNAHWATGPYSPNIRPVLHGRSSRGQLMVPSGGEELGGSIGSWKTTP